MPLATKRALYLIQLTYLANYEFKGIFGGITYRYLLSKLKSAEFFAKEKHAHMKRKDGVTPYLDHLKNVVSRLKSIGINDEDILCAGWLHDTIEDTNTDFDDIYERFGRKVAVLVSSLTKDNRLEKDERERQYMKQLKSAPWEAKLIKLCDISSNLKDLHNSGLSRLKRIKQVKQKLHYLNIIKTELVENKTKVLAIQNLIDDINEVLTEYGLRSLKI